MTGNGVERKKTFVTNVTIGAFFVVTFVENTMWLRLAKLLFHFLTRFTIFLRVNQNGYSKLDLLITYLVHNLQNVKLEPISTLRHDLSFFRLKNRDQIYQKADNAKCLGPTKKVSSNDHMKTKGRPYKKF